MLKKAEQNETVTVVMPCYNSMPFLPAAVESIVNQTLQSWRLVVINDGSTDGTREYLESLTDDRIFVLHQENTGLSHSLNRGLQHCDSEFIARMDGDDCSLPDRLEKQLAFLQSNPDVGLVGTQIQRVGMRRSDTGSSLPTSHDEIVSALMCGGHALCHPTIMCRKSVFDEVGEYQTGLGEEWDIFLRFGEVSKLANLSECLLKYRFHGSSINGSRMRELRRGIRFACESSRRRKAAEPAISYDQFIELEKNAPLLQRIQRNTEDYSRASYHAAMADILGNHRLRGFAKLGVAAVSAPQLAFHRIHRKLSGPKSARKKTAQNPGVVQPVSNKTS